MNLTQSCQKLRLKSAAAHPSRLSSARQCNSLKFRTMDRHIPSKNTILKKHDWVSVSPTTNRKPFIKDISHFYLPLKVFLQKKLVCLRDIFLTFSHWLKVSYRVSHWLKVSYSFSHWLKVSCRVSHRQRGCANFWHR